MNAPMREDGNGNYLIGKKNVYVSLAVLIIVVIASGYTVERATNFENTLNWNTRQISQILARQEKQAERLAAIELKASHLEWRFDRLDQRVRGNAGAASTVPIPAHDRLHNGAEINDSK